MNETEIILGMLGDSSNKIAKRLEAMGITGVQCRFDLCPVSEFLKDVGYFSAHIDKEVCTLRDGDLDPTHLLARTSEPIRDFIKNFDNFEYPNLIKKFCSCPWYD